MLFLCEGIPTIKYLSDEYAKNGDAEGMHEAIKKVF